MCAVVLDVPTTILIIILFCIYNIRTLNWREKVKCQKLGLTIALLIYYSIGRSTL